MLFKDWYFPSLLHYEEEKVQEEQSERRKKIDELYAMSTDEKPRRKGKHF